MSFSNAPAPLLPDRYLSQADSRELSPRRPGTSQ